MVFQWVAFWGDPITGTPADSGTIWALQIRLLLYLCYDYQPFCFQYHHYHRRYHCHKNDKHIHHASCLFHLLCFLWLVNTLLWGSFPGISLWHFIVLTAWEGTWPPVKSWRRFGWGVDRWMHGWTSARRISGSLHYLQLYSFFHKWPLWTLIIDGFPIINCPFWGVHHETNPYAQRTTCYHSYLCPVNPPWPLWWSPDRKSRIPLSYRETLREANVKFILVGYHFEIAGFWWELFLNLWLWLWKNWVSSEPFESGRQKLMATTRRCLESRLIMWSLKLWSCSRN